MYEGLWTIVKGDLSSSTHDIDHKKRAYRTHRFRGQRAPKTLEAKKLSDADKLDAIGAVGIARMFMLAGEFGELLFHETDIDEYRKKNVAKDGRIKRIDKHSPLPII